MVSNFKNRPTNDIGSGSAVIKKIFLYILAALAAVAALNDLKIQLWIKILFQSFLFPVRCDFDIYLYQYKNFHINDI